MRWVVIGIASLLVGLLAYGVASQGADTSLDAAVQEGKRPPAPDSRLPMLGESTDGAIDDYRGKIVLVNFWASWCPPCKDELPLLQKTQTTLEAKGGTVLGINTRDVSEKALELVAQYKLTYPSLRDGSGDYADRWGLTGYPESFLLDKAGRVVALRRGPLTQRWIDETVVPFLERS